MDYQLREQLCFLYHLPPGEYEFEVRGSNNDHQWNEKTTTLRVVITPPWWRSSFAYFIYILLLMGGLSGLHGAGIFA